MQRLETHNFIKKVIMDCRKCENKKCILYQNCSINWLEYIQQVKTTSNLAIGKKIFSEGDLVHGIYIVCSGKIQLSMRVSDEQNDILRLAGSGQIVGHRGFYDDMKYPISAETITQSEIVFISTDDFIKLLRTNSDLALFLILFYSSELLHSDQKLKLNTNDSNQSRVLFALQRVYEAFGEKKDNKMWMELGLGLDSLANFASVSPEDLIEVLDELKTESKLALEGERINIIDKKFFISYAVN